MFNNEEKIDRLIESVDKNLISYPEMISLLEFVTIHETAILGGEVNIDRSVTQPKEEAKVKVREFNFE